ncbi:MAG: hypothetical protein K6C08_02745 [Oscillospiraceae bacterium]|nr:hypothetical protein [Oscillospiraceae bacterium]
MAAIARQIKAESGNKAYHGGVYPENISRNPDGVIGIGPVKRSDWSEEELAYIAPEIYWNNKPCPQSDVYALGLILYYGASEGKLPFAGSSSNAQLMRMSGKTVYSPAAAGSQLGEIIEKSLKFKEADRYRTPEELAVMLDYCEDRRLLKQKSGAEAIFKKEENELSDLEQIMLNIIDGTEEVPSEENTVPEEEAVERLPQTEEEIFAAAGLVRPEPAVRKPDWSGLEEIFGLDEPDPVDQAELEAEEEIRVYEPGGNKDGQTVTEGGDPTLAPVMPARKNTAVKVRKPRPQPVREVPEEEEEQKRRPFLVVLLLLAVLVIAAVVANILIRAFSEPTTPSVPGNVTVVTPSAAPSDSSFDVSAILSEEQIQYQQQLDEQAQQEQQPEPEPTVDPATLPHSYEAIKADVGWTAARDDAAARGGYLVTINSQEEFNTVVQLAEEAGFDRVWVGGHRVNGEMVWESGEDVAYYKWGRGEPSYTDSGDGAAEDYILLWKFNGEWVYNDSRENPLTDYYGMYSGRVGYVIEKVG